MDIKSELLTYFKISENEYEYLTRPLSYKDIPSASLFNDIEKVKTLVLDSIKSNESIMIYGDYDCDGVMSTSIMVKTLKMMGAKVGYYVPSRYIDGYAINASRCDEIIEKGYKLIITVDNGISAFESIDKLKEAGIKVIVIDHHEVLDKLPNADAIIHTDFSKLNETKTSAGFLSFLVSSYLLNKIEPHFLTLASISIVSDMMPLVSYNRDVLRLSILSYENSPMMQIDLLKEKEDFDEVSIGMKIAPKINALGRLLQTTKVNKLITYFTSEDEKEILSIYQFIIDTNNKKKEFQESISKEEIHFEPSQKSIVKMSEAMEGFSSIFANQLINKYNVPVCVFATSFKDPEILKGSMRSKEGCSLTEFTKTFGSIFIEAGGHSLASGVTIKKKDLELFTKLFEEFAIRHPFKKVERKYIEIEKEDINFQTYDILNSLAPFGEGFEAPWFSISYLPTFALSYSKNKLSIFTKLNNSSIISGFGISEKSLIGVPSISIYGHIKKTNFFTKPCVQFSIEEIKKSN